MTKKTSQAQLDRQKANRERRKKLLASIGFESGKPMEQFYNSLEEATPQALNMIKLILAGEVEITDDEEIIFLEEEPKAVENPEVAEAKHTVESPSLFGQHVKPKKEQKKPAHFTPYQRPKQMWEHGGQSQRAAGIGDNKVAPREVIQQMIEDAKTG